jgi:hypothetical protein
LGWIHGPKIFPLNLYRTANLLVQQHGPDDALLMAAKR